VKEKDSGREEHFWRLKRELQGKKTKEGKGRNKEKYKREKEGRNIENSLKYKNRKISVFYFFRRIRVDVCPVRTRSKCSNNNNNKIKKFEKILKKIKNPENFQNFENFRK